MSKQVLEVFVRRTLEGKGDVFAKRMAKSYGKHYESMVKNLTINERTIDPGLCIVTKELFLHRYPVRYSSVLFLLTFCTELDKHCKTNHSRWYKEAICYMIVIIPHPHTVIIYAISFILLVFFYQLCAHLNDHEGAHSNRFTQKMLLL